MAQINEKIAAEVENIKHVLAELPEADAIENLSPLELAGVAALIHNFYNGVENILKQLILSRELKIPEGSSWHKDLINISVTNGLISSSVAKLLREYLAFRHFFSHGYSFDLDANKIILLVKQIGHTYNCFAKDIKHLLKDS